MALPSDAHRLNGLDADCCCILCGQLDKSPPGAISERELQLELLEDPQLSRGVLAYALATTAFASRSKHNDYAMQVQLQAKKGEAAKFARCNLLGVLAHCCAHRLRVRMLPRGRWRGRGWDELHALLCSRTALHCCIAALLCSRTQLTMPSLSALTPPYALCASPLLRAGHMACGGR